jgi:1,4-alpha-glucan branching enzyme
MGTRRTPEIGKVQGGVSLFTGEDIYLFREGTHFTLYEKLGSHLMAHGGTEGTYFALWAPNAKRVSVIGDFNRWDASAHPLSARADDSGIWEGFIPGVGEGSLYKYHIVSRYDGYQVDKGDPFARLWQKPPETASIVWSLDHEWHDAEWIAARGEKNGMRAAISVYEMHLGSWRRVPEEGGRPLTYTETASYLVAYLKETGFTHVELMPVMEHPFYGSWGYQISGYYAPTHRYGTPQEFMGLVDTLHQNGIGVILDWVPSHFVSDEHGLVFFDGTHLYEHADPKQGMQPDWNSYIFNYGRPEVRAFLISNALYWLDAYHADGLRVDAVASMLYLDYSRREGQWVPNRFGGRENLEAIDFLKKMNQTVYERFPDVQTTAEESTAWPQVSRPTYLGGLGFGMKWNMGWMHDTLYYFSRDPIHRKHHHDGITFSILYAFNENFVLPLSHDEVVHGKGSLLGKMPGDEWQKFANLRLLLGYMYAHPGKKLLFMGGEFGQLREWNHDTTLDWHLVKYLPHDGVRRWVRDLNALYRRETALHAGDFDASGFSWVDFHDREQSVLHFLRLEPAASMPGTSMSLASMPAAMPGTSMSLSGAPGREVMLVSCNFTPVVRDNYRVGVPEKGFWREVANSNAKEYGGTGHGNLGGVRTSPIPYHGRAQSLSLTLPPLAVLFFKWEGEAGERANDGGEG